MLAALACVALPHLLFLEREQGSPGVVRRGIKPVVHRMWRNISAFPVPRSRWESVGFAVDDYDHASAFAVVTKSGYGREWEALPHYAAKADLFRLVILYQRGGWWADADMSPNPGIRTLASTTATVLFHEACGFQWINRFKYAVGLSTITHAPQYRNSIFAARAKSAVLGGALRMLRVRVATTPQPWSIPTQIDTTGPGLLTDAVNRHPKHQRRAALITCSVQGRYMHHLGLRTWY